MHSQLQSWRQVEAAIAPATAMAGVTPHRAHAWKVFARPSRVVAALYLVAACLATACVGVLPLVPLHLSHQPATDKALVWPFHFIVVPVATTACLVALVAHADKVAGINASRMAIPAGTAVGTAVQTATLAVVSHGLQWRTTDAVILVSTVLSACVAFGVYFALVPSHERQQQASSLAAKTFVHAVTALAAAWGAVLYLLPAANHMHTALFAAVYVFIVLCGRLSHRVSLYTSRAAGPDVVPEAPALVNGIACCARAWAYAKAPTHGHMAIMAAVDAVVLTHAVLSFSGHASTYTAFARSSVDATSRCLLRPLRIALGAARRSGPFQRCRCSRLAVRHTSVLPMTTTTNEPRGRPAASVKRHTAGGSEPRISPDQFQLVCLLYQQRAPKIFAQYDGDALHRKRIFAALSLTSFLAPHILALLLVATTSATAAVAPPATGLQMLTARHLQMLLAIALAAPCVLAAVCFLASTSRLVPLLRLWRFQITTSRLQPPLTTAASFAFFALLIVTHC